MTSGFKMNQSFLEPDDKIRDFPRLEQQAIKPSPPVVLWSQTHDEKATLEKATLMEKGYLDLAITHTSKSIS